MARLTISCVVRRFCLECQGHSSKAVRECADAHCALWEHRLPPQSANHQGDSMPHDTLAEDSGGEPIPVKTEDFAKTEDGEHTRRETKTALTTLIEKTAEVEANVSRPDIKAREAARRLILRAVRRHCLTCAACRAEVRTCNARECGLWSYRFGVYPETYRTVRQRLSRPKTLSLF